MRIQSRWRATAALMGALALSAGLMSGAGADEPVEGSSRVYTLDGQGAVSVPSKQLLQDVAAVRGREEVSPDDALLWQNDFAIAVTELQEQYPQAYSASEINVDTGKAWVSFKAEAPKGALARLKAVPAKIEVREGIGWSEEDIAAVGQKAHYEALENAAFEDVYTNTDAAEGTVTVHANPAKGVALETAKAALGSVEARSQMSRSVDGLPLAGVTVDYRLDEDVDGGMDTHYGGAKLTSGSGYCTSGFSVYKYNSYQNGLITAAHCSNSLSYSGNSLDFRSQSSTLDVQWHTDSEYAAPRFYVGSSTLRDVDVSSNPTVGQSVCRYGRTNPSSCDRVALLNQCRGDYCGLAMVYTREAAPGDSGGPWYYGNVAYGVHSGYMWLDSQKRDVFTPLQKAVSNLGIAVKM